MFRSTRRSIGVWMSLAVVLCFTLGAAAQVSPDLFSGLRWRNVGPYHGGRIAAVSGVIGEPGTFYVGLPQGGIWKTTSGGMTWYPVFDQVTEVDSIGAIQVAPSDPNIIYAGSGDIVSGLVQAPMATGCTSPPTPAKPGRTSASTVPRESPRSWSIRKIRIS